MERPDALCAVTMRGQHGVISLEQALGHGLSRRAIQRRVESRAWTRCLPRVYAAAAAPATWEQQLTAAVLWGGRGAAVSHRAAARLWELPGFAGAAVELTIPRRRKPPRGLVVHSRHVEPFEATARRGVVVTTTARTLLDVSSRCRFDALDVAVHHCIRTGLVTPGELEQASDGFGGRGAAGAPRIRRVLAAYGASANAPQSPLEARVLRLLKRSGLPAPARQHEVRPANGRRRYLDFAWPSIKLAVEADGYQWHSSRSAWERDRRRLRELSDLGWEVLSVTHGDLQRPDDFLRALRRAHQRRSTA